MAAAATSWGFLKRAVVLGRQTVSRNAVHSRLEICSRPYVIKCMSSTVGARLTVLPASQAPQPSQASQRRCGFSTAAKWPAEAPFVRESSVTFPSLNMAPTRQQEKQIVETAIRCLGNANLESAEDVYSHTDNNTVYLDIFAARDAKKRDRFHFYSLFAGDTECGAVFEGDSLEPILISDDGTFTATTDSYKGLADALEKAVHTDKSFKTRKTRKSQKKGG